MARVMFNGSGSNFEVKAVMSQCNVLKWDINAILMHNGSLWLRVTGSDVSLPKWKWYLSISLSRLSVRSVSLRVLRYRLSKTSKAPSSQLNRFFIDGSLSTRTLNGSSLKSLYTKQLSAKGAACKLHGKRRALIRFWQSCPTVGCPRRSAVSRHSPDADSYRRRARVCIRVRCRAVRTWFLVPYALIFMCPHVAGLEGALEDLRPRPLILINLKIQLKINNKYQNVDYLHKFMSLHVDPQIVSTVAREMTVFTLERLLVGVCHQMPFKFVIITEHYVARLEGALEDLRPYANALRRCHLNLRNLKIQLKIKNKYQNVLKNYYSKLF